MASRFDQVRNYMEALTEWAKVSTEDSSLVVDTAEVELQVQCYSAHLDELLAIPPTPDNRGAISKKIASLMAAADGIKASCHDLNGSLDHLMDALWAESGADEEYDASDR